MPQVKPVPGGMHTVTPHLVCAGAADATEFHEKAVKAVDEGRVPGQQAVHNMTGSCPEGGVK